MLDVQKLKGWVPIDAIVSDGRPGLLWMDVRGEKFSEPFFQQTVERLRRQTPSREELFTEFDATLQFEKIAAGLKPDGFIFHSSRCGSTLVANALKCLHDSIVVSEASPIDKLIARFNTDAADHKKQILYSLFLRGVVSAFGQQHRGDERRLFIKFSCCSTAQLNYIQRIWPDVPWLFLYRDPVETIVSNLKTRPEWLLDPDRRILASINEVTVQQISEMSDEELCARSIGKFYLSAHQLANDRSLLLNYSQLSVPILLQVLQFFSVEPTPDEVEAIEQVNLLYSKDIGASRSFASDSDSKRNAASSLVMDMARTWAGDSYEMVEHKRLMSAAA